MSHRPGAAYTALMLSARARWYPVVVVVVTVLALLLAAGHAARRGVPAAHAGVAGPQPGTLSLTASLGLLVFGLAAPLSGRLMDRFGPRRVAGAGLLLVAVSFALSTRVGSALGLHLTWGLLSGLGTGLVGSVLGATVATRWFVRRRGWWWACPARRRARGSCCSFRC